MPRRMAWSNARLPWQRISLQVGKAFHRFLHSFLVAEARVLDAAEGSELQAVSGNLAHVDAADVELGDEAGDPVEAIGAHRGGQSVVGRVGDAYRVVDILEANHRRHWAEGLVFYNFHVGQHMIEHRRRVQRTRAKVAVEELRAAL